MLYAHASIHMLIYMYMLCRKNRRFRVYAEGILEEIGVNSKQYRILDVKDWSIEVKKVQIEPGNAGLRVDLMKLNSEKYITMWLVAENDTERRNWCLYLAGARDPDGKEAQQVRYLLAQVKHFAHSCMY